MAKIISVAIENGGGSKTTTAVHLAHGLALEGRRVLIIDADPQGDCWEYFSDAPPPKTGLFEIMNESVGRNLNEGKPLSQDEIIELFNKHKIKEIRENLTILPGTQMLKTMITNLSKMPHGSEFVLLDLIEAIENEFDYIIFDTNPMQTKLNINVYFASDELFAPYWLVPKTQKNMTNFVRQYTRIAALQKKLFRQVKIKMKYVLPVSEAPTRSSKSAYEEVKNMVFAFQELAQHDYEYDGFQEVQLLPPIPRRTILSELVMVGQTIYEYDALCDASQAYQMVVEKVIANEK